ncbi:MAG: hypothetical protein QOH96_3211 [Blastocatellia bacterium]|nr:hypothetical protein [Blastocatellia bacterium]
MGKVKIGKFEVDDETLATQHREAVRRGKETMQTQPRAVEAYYENGRVVVNLSNGCTFIFPPEISQGLAGASPSDLKEVEILPPGFALHWETLDADFSLPGLMAGIFGSNAWMAEEGRHGGSATTEAKVRASRENGAKGGRPRKPVGKQEKQKRA